MSYSLLLKSVDQFPNKQCEIKARLLATSLTQPICVLCMTDGFVAKYLQPLADVSREMAVII